MTINGGTNTSGWTFKLEAYEVGNYSISNNTSTVRVDMYLGRSDSQSYLGGDWNGSITVDGQTQYLSGNIAWPTYVNAGAWLYLGTKDYTVTHNTDGSKVAGISASFSSGDFSPSSAWASGNLTLTTIPRASSVTATNADIGSATSININRASSSFKHTLKYRFGSLSGTIATNIDTSYGWTIPDTFYAQIPNAKTGTCTITCETYSGSTLIGSKTTTFTVTANETLCKPILTASVIDINQDTIDLTNDNQKLVKYYSNAQITYSTTARNSATITKVTINDVEVSDGSHVFENNTADTFTVKVTDSRGYVTTLLLEPTIVNYVPLTVSPSFYRTAPTTGEMSLTFSGNYFNNTFGNVANTLSIKWYYKLRDSETWITGGTLVLNTDYKIIDNTYHSGDTDFEIPIDLGDTFDYQNQYDFKIEVEDQLEHLIIVQSVSKGQPIVNWDDDHFNVNGDITQYEQPFNIPSVIDNLDGNSTTDAPSQRAVKQLTTYSTTEIKIGTWIDGKPLYRKVIESTSGNAGVETVIGSISNFKYLKTLTGTIVNSVNASVNFPFIFNANNLGELFISSDGSINCLVTNGAYATRPIKVIVEYTKTTD